MHSRATVTAAFWLLIFAGAAQAQSGPEALAAAIGKRQPGAVVALIAQGVDVNATHEGMTPLYRAAQGPEHPEIVQLLIARGAQVGARSSDRGLPLRVAHAFGNAQGIFETVEALMARSSGPAGRTAEGLSPLHVASSPQLIKALIERAARVDARDVAGNTPLFWAAMRYNQAAAEVLLQHGADINARNAGGLTPLDAAAAMRHSMLETYLRARGAKSGAGLASPELSEADLRGRLETARSPLTAMVLGRRSDEAALRKIVEWRDTGLLEAYVPGPYSVNGGKFRMSPEKLALLQPTLRQSWPSERAKDNVVLQISRSGLPGIEQPLLDALASVPERSRREIEEQLAERRFEPIVPYIAERLSDPDATRCTNLARIGSIAAAAQMVRCLARLTELRRGGHDDVLYALAKHGGIPEVDFAALRKALPPVMNEKTTVRYFELVGLHQPASEVPLLIAAMRDNAPASWVGGAARGALAQFRSEEVQKQVAAELGQLVAAGKIDQASSQYVLGRYAEFRRLPANYKAAIEGQAGNRFARDKEQLDRVKRSAELYRETQPERYVQEYDAYLAQVAALAEKYRSDVYFDGLRSDVEQGYRMLGDFSRFKLGRPSQAIDYYTKAAGLSAATRGHEYVTDLLAGDLFQFDLKDRSKALAAYRRAAERLRASGPGRNDWLAGALAHEIGYLEHGKPFSGSMGAADVEQFFGMVFLAAAGAFGDPGIGPASLQAQSVATAERKALEQRLEQLAPSHLNFLKAVPLLSLVSSEQTVSRFFQKHDPGGYWSASLALGVLHPELLGERGAAAFLPGLSADPAKAAALTAAARKLAKERGVGLRPPNARRATPEGTWQLMLDALRSGDAETALGCFTPAMRSKFEPLFTTMSSSAMREMADSFTSFSLQAGDNQVREAVLTRRIANQPQQAGFAYFVRHAGEWKIDQM
jgi:hypothetical protein